jgi:hypothetical protein
MLDEELKKRIRLYSVREHESSKAARRRADAMEVADGHAEKVQERNRALPHASHFVFSDQEPLLPSE